MSAVSAREAARQDDGRFGEQERSAPEVDLAPTLQVKLAGLVAKGDIVWDGDTGFVVDGVRAVYDPLYDREEVQLTSHDGEIWQVRPSQNITVLRDLGVLAELLEPSEY